MERDQTAVILGLDKAPPVPRVFGLDSPERLKAWLLSTGREFLIFSSADLVDALPWPNGVETVQHLVQCYAQHRRAIQVGVVSAFEPGLNISVQRPVYKGEALTVEEIEEAIACLVRDIRKLKPDWKPSW